MEALIPFKEGHQSLFRLHVSLGGSSNVGKKCDCLQIKEFGLKWKKWLMTRPSRTYWNLVYLLKDLERVLIQKKWGSNRKNRFCGEMWENIVWVGREEACKNPAKLCMEEDYMETVQYTLVNISIDFVTKLQKCTPSAKNRSASEKWNQLDAALFVQTGYETRTRWNDIRL